MDEHAGQQEPLAPDAGPAVETTAAPGSEAPGAVPASLIEPMVVLPRAAGGGSGGVLATVIVPELPPAIAAPIGEEGVDVTGDVAPAEIEHLPPEPVAIDPPAPTTALVEVEATPGLEHADEPIEAAEAAAGASDQDAAERSTGPATFGPDDEPRARPQPDAIAGEVAFSPEASPDVRERASTSVHLPPTPTVDAPRPEPSEDTVVPAAAVAAGEEAQYEPPGSREPQAPPAPQHEPVAGITSQATAAAPPPRDVPEIPGALTTGVPEALHDIRQAYKSIPVVERVHPREPIWQEDQPPRAPLAPRTPEVTWVPPLPPRPTPDLAPIAEARPLPLPRERAPLARRRYLRWAVIGALSLMLAYAALLLSLVVLYRYVDPPMSALMLGQRLTGTAVRQRWTPLERISPNLRHAVIVSEDAAFCRHRGVDWAELAEAIDSSRDGVARGGSTISMQVVKNLFLWPSRSYVRKAIEIPMAYLIEMMWSKRRILEIYLNIAEWGPGVFGAEIAALYHFRKPPSLLSPREAALLAVSLPNPLEREAGSPGPGTLRLADNLMLRMKGSQANAGCVRTPVSGR